MRNDDAGLIFPAPTAPAAGTPSVNPRGGDAKGDEAPPPVGATGGRAARLSGLVASAGAAPPASDMPGRAARGEPMAPGGSCGFAGRFKLRDGNMGFRVAAGVRAGVALGNAMT